MAVAVTLDHDRTPRVAGVASQVVRGVQLSHVCRRDPMATRNNKTRPAEHRGYNVKKCRDIVVMDANSTPLPRHFS